MWLLPRVDIFALGPGEQLIQPALYQEGVGCSVAQWDGLGLSKYVLTVSVILPTCGLPAGVTVWEHGLLVTPATEGTFLYTAHSIVQPVTIHHTVYIVLVYSSLDTSSKEMRTHGDKSR